MPENISTLRGILFSKDCRKIPNKKKPTEPDWEFFSIKLETKVNVGGRTLTAIPELQLSKGVTYDAFEVGQEIEVSYFLDGKKLSDVWYKTDPKALFIKLINNNGIKSSVVETPQDRVFTPPSPINDENDDIPSDLPF